MKKFLIMIPALAALAACETPNQTRTAGALAGAALGANIADNKDSNAISGAALGAAAGLVAGEVISQSRTPGECIYQRPDGTQYVAAC
ncbi:hypothetical protein BFP70_01270 [Thioclava sp. SK-1]|uniref:YMGG-like glycine zipper-containing protein n=1 Tax=Thioclava sp. SK-1 TaxID=1889770 RepID=UPI00082694C1|nr:glycine zipper domain-containing protein [Thioclava sp. SK-1]OCX66812.1 hypothetical protein BFP70_01270 [Thioclava sp. SK-1]